MWKKFLTSLTVSLSLLLASSGAWAGEATTVVRDSQAKLFAVIAKPKTAARQAQLKALFDRFIDYDQMAVASMGSKWDSLTDAQQTQFKKLLTRLIRGNYKKNLKELLKFDISYEAEVTDGGAVVVNTTATHKTDQREPPFDLDLRMVQSGGSWMIVDIITEDASMVKTYRAQFLRILKKSGFDKLVDKMQTKLDKLDKEHGE